MDKNNTTTNNKLTQLPIKRQFNSTTKLHKQQNSEPNHKSQ